MNNKDPKEEIEKQINSFALCHVKFNKIDDYMENYKFYLSKASYREEIFEKENRFNETIPVKMAIIDDIRYVNTSMYDDDVTIIRIFTITTPRDVQYFSSTGSYTYFGEPDQHTRNDFLRFLENHPNLKDNDLVKQITATIFHNELQDDLTISDAQSKKHKL